MNLFRNKRNMIIAVFLLALVVISVAYASLIQQLKVKGVSGIAANSWIIYFDNVYQKKGSITPNTAAYITNAERSNIDFAITMKNPGDMYGFEVDMVNDGTEDAMIHSVSVSGIPERLRNYISWQVTYLNGEEIKKCDILYKNTRRRIKVIVTFNKDISNLPESDSLDLSFSVHYMQIDKNECPNDYVYDDSDVIPEDGKYTLRIDPNYGKYNGTDKVTSIRMAEGETYEVGIPVHDSHTFTGWSVSVDGVYNATSNIVTMGDNNVTLVAQWDWDQVYPDDEIKGYCFLVGTNRYNTWSSALGSISDEGTIVLLDNNCFIDTESTISSSQNVTFDLNGHVITQTQQITNNGVFNIIDSSDRKSGEMNNNVDNAFYNQGTMNINGGKYNIINRLLDNAYPSSPDDLYSAEVQDASIYLAQNGGYSNSVFNSYGDLTLRNVYVRGNEAENFGSKKFIYTDGNSHTYLYNVDYELDNSRGYFVQAFNDIEIYNCNVVLKSIREYTGEIIYVSGADKFVIEDTNIKGNVVTNGGVRGFYLENISGVSTMENVNIEITGDVTSMCQGIYTMSTKLDMKNVNMDILLNEGYNRGTFTYYGAYLNADATMDNVNLNFIDNSLNGGDIEGIRADYATSYKNSKVYIKCLTGKDTYAVRGPSELQYLDIDIIQGTGDFHGIYGSSVIDHVDLYGSIDRKGNYWTVWGVEYGGAISNSRIEIVAPSDMTISGTDFTNIVDSEVIVNGVSRTY